MEQVYDLFKSFIDPTFILFVFLAVSCVIWMADSKKKSGAIFLLFTLVLLYGFSIQPVSNYLSYQLEKKYIHVRPVEKKEALDVIVVLSGGAYDVKPLGTSFCGESTVTRLAHAVRMFNEHHAKYLVCSGTGGSKVSGAALMAQMAQDFGIPKERIRIEAKSENTYEHAREFNNMFADKGLKVGLVTSAYHMRRSEKSFKKFFTAVTPLPSDYLYASPEKPGAVRYIPQSEWLLNNTRVFREYIGQIWYGIREL